MDWPLYCVIDNKDDKDITEDILCIRKDASSSRYSIIFTNNPTEFHFSLDRITFLDKPNMLDISDKKSIKSYNLTLGAKSSISMGKGVLFPFPIFS